MYFYLIFSVENGRYNLLNITSDYYYFRRLLKKYSGFLIAKKKILIDNLIEYSEFL